ncbi:HAD family hydrolase [Psychromonas sp. KJ10-10]|uniref:HAD family hydrolase n=1 Tax=Psychromonas sp. KJ10-10 TaxID=3391823 RepID=UPI0039B55C92
MNILFDLDDTLHDKKASLRNYALSIWDNNSSCIESDQNSFVSAFINENSIIQPKVDVFKNLSLKFHISKNVSDRLLNEFDSTFHEFAVPFSNASAVLKFSKDADVNIACVTNGRDFFQKNKISALGFSPYFDVLITSGGFGVKKPDHSIFLESLRLLGSDNDFTCFCGDSL